MLDYSMLRYVLHGGRSMVGKDVNCHSGSRFLFFFHLHLIRRRNWINAAYAKSATFCRFSAIHTLFNCWLLRFRYIPPSWRRFKYFLQRPVHHVNRESQSGLVWRTCLSGKVERSGVFFAFTAKSFHGPRILYGIDSLEIRIKRNENMRNYIFIVH